MVQIIRYEVDGVRHCGVLEGERIARVRGTALDGLEPTGEHDDLAAVRIVAPLDPTRIIGVGWNYAVLTEMTGREPPEVPNLFMKPTTAVIGSGDPIVYPDGVEEVHCEAELTVVIGRHARHVPEHQALDHVLGYTCGNDVTDRKLQLKERLFGCTFAAKAYDSFAPLGPVIATGLDPAAVQLRMRVNGAERQNDTTANLIFPVPRLIAYLSRIMTLLPGDCIMTGTPAGAAQAIHVGDVVEIEMSGIGVLRNELVPETA